MQSIDRRRFLAVSACAGLAVAGAGFRPLRTRAESPSASPKRVLVLGAGMSGLSAALALHRRGHDVQVIEFQDRVGGRLISVPLENGQFTEGGGGHFRTNMPLVCAYLRKFDLPLVSMNDGCPLYHVDGQVGDGTLTKPWPWPLHDYERNVDLPSLLARYLVRSGIDLRTVLDPEWPDPATLGRFDKVTLRALLQGAGASEAFIKLVDAHSAEATVDTAVLALMPDFAYHFGDRNLFRVAGGNDRLPKAIAEVLGERVHLGAAVASIEQDAASATVKTQDGRRWTGDAVVSTIPFLVLRELQIVPKLSPNKRKLVDELEWAPVVKVYVQTKAPVWLDRGIHGWPMAASDRPWERIVDISGNEAGGNGNVFFYLTGRNAEAYLREDKQRRPMEMLNKFRSDHPGILEDVIALGEFSWPDQPWIKAAFANLPVGAGWMIEEWKRPEGRIHFAGDFTTLKSGWVEGAIESGLRAARQIDPEVSSESV